MSTKNGEQLLYEDLTYKIRGACFEVWKEFGNAFKESVVKNALIKKLQDLGLKVEVNKRINIYFEGKKVGVYIPDLIINNLILIELKRKPFLTKQDDQQFWYYLKCTNYKLGFLINFGDRGLEIKRRIFDKARATLPRSSASPSANIRLDNNGFSLMELLVSVSIFVIVAIAGLSIYMATLRASQKTVALTRIQQESQMIMSVLAKKIRTSKVNYNYTGYPSYPTPISNPVTELALIDLLDDTYDFKLSGNFLTVSFNGGLDKVLPATYVSINDIKFYIIPTTDPSTLIQQYEEGLINTLPQPYITIVMTVSSQKAAQAGSLIIQQTVPQRSALVE